MKKIFNRMVQSSFGATLFILIVFCLLLAKYAPGFATAKNIDTLLKATSITIVVGLAQGCTISVGNFNLALGSMGCLSGMAMLGVYQFFDWPIGCAIALGLVTGMLLGGIQGWLTAKSGLNPFATSLALGSVYLGIAQVIFQRNVLNKKSDLILAINKRTILGGIPVIFVIALALVFIVWFVLKKTTLGRKMIATGENKRSAEIAGLMPTSQLLVAHISSGFMAAMAALLTVSRTGAAQYSVGTDWMLYSFAAPVLGGTLLSGGHISTWGIIVGAALINVIKVGLVQIHVNSFWMDAFLGALLILSFSIDGIRRDLLTKGKAGRKEEKK